MDTPESKPSKEKAADWLSDARAHLGTNEEADHDEKLYFSRYVDIAEELAELAPSVEEELARLQDARATARFDVLGLQLSLLPMALQKYRRQCKQAVESIDQADNGS